MWCLKDEGPSVVGGCDVATTVIRAARVMFGGKVSRFLIFGSYGVCMVLLVTTPAGAEPCARDYFQSEANSILETCKAIQSDCNVWDAFKADSNVYENCRSAYLEKRRACLGKVATVRQSGQRNVRECRNHLRRMREDQERRRVDKVRSREKLRRSEEHARVNAVRERTSLSKLLQGAKEKYDAAKGYANDVSTLLTSKGDWRKQYEATHNLVQRTNDLAPRLELSRQLTESSLRGVSSFHTDALSSFETAMDSISGDYEAALKVSAGRRVSLRQTDGDLEAVERAVAEALERQRAAERELSRQRTTNNQAVRDAKTYIRNRERAARQQQANQFLNGLIGGALGAATIYNSTRGGSSGGSRRPAQRQYPGGGRGGCTDGEFINC